MTRAEEPSRPRDVPGRPGDRLGQEAGPDTPHLATSFSLAFLGSASLNVTQLVIAAVIAKLGSPAALGAYALGHAICAPVFMLSDLQLRTVAATDTRGLYSDASYLAVRTVTVAAAILLVFSVARVIVDEPQRAVLVLVALAKGTEGLAEIVYGCMQRRERLDLVSRSMVLRAATGAAGFGGAYWATGSLEAGLSTLAVVWLLSFVTHDLRWVRKAGPYCFGLAGGTLAPANEANSPSRIVTLPTLVRQALPLGLGLTAASLATNVPRVVLERSSGLSALGLFSGVYYVATGMLTVMGALAQAVRPRLARAWQSPHTRTAIIGQVTRVALAAAATLLVTGWFFGAPLLSVIFSDDYSSEKALLMIMLGATSVFFASNALHIAIQAARRFHTELAISLSGLVVSAVASLVMVPRFDATGAAVAFLAYALTDLAAASAGYSRALKLYDPT